MTSNILLINPDKTFVFGRGHFRNRLSIHVDTLDDITLTSGTTVRSLGVIFDLLFKSVTSFSVYLPM